MLNLCYFFGGVGCIHKLGLAENFLPNNAGVTPDTCGQIAKVPALSHFEFSPFHALL